MKRNYDGLSFKLVYASLTSSILKGSVTELPISVDEVTVKNYESGFGDDTFKDISF